MMRGPNGWISLRGMRTVILLASLGGLAAPPSPARAADAPRQTETPAPPPSSPMPPRPRGCTPPPAPPTS